MLLCRSTQNIAEVCSVRTRSWWPWLFLLTLVVGGWFGWRYSQLLRYQANAHQHFVNRFQNGIRGAYSEAERARLFLAEGKPEPAAHSLTSSHHYLQKMFLGAAGMSIKLGTQPIRLDVLSRYSQEATMLREELTNGTITPDLMQRLDVFVHDLKLLLESLGSHEQEDWLTQATADEISARYDSWREKATISPEVP